MLRSKQDNIDKLEKMGAQCIGTNDLSVFDDIWAADLVDRDPAPGQGLEKFWNEFLAAFPDLTIEAIRCSPRQRLVDGHLPIRAAPQ